MKKVGSCPLQTNPAQKPDSIPLDYADKLGIILRRRADLAVMGLDRTQTASFGGMAERTKRINPFLGGRLFVRWSGRSTGAFQETTTRT